MQQGVRLSLTETGVAITLPKIGKEIGPSTSKSERALLCDSTFQLFYSYDFT